MDDAGADDGHDSDLAHWLEDSGRRRGIRLSESPEELLAHIEGLTGRQLRSREAIAAYVNELKEQGVVRQRSESRRANTRQAILILVLALSVAQYYYWDVNLLIAGLQKVYYFGFDPGAKPKDLSAAPA